MTKRELNVYWSWEDFVRKVESTDIPDHRCGSSSTNEKGHSWDKGLGYEGSLVAARDGWHEPLEQVERLATHVEDKIDLELFQTAFEAVRDVSGGEVDIDRYLQGEPECMIESTPIRISRHGRAVRVVVPISYSCFVNEQQVVNRGAAIVALCDLLARAQHPVEVWAVVALTTNPSRANQQRNSHRPEFCDLVRVQAADDALDVPRLLFGIAHPAGFRRLGFRSIEQIEDPGLARSIGGNYGFPIGVHDEDLPDQVDNTIVLDHLGSDGSTWSQDEATAWITGVLDQVFD